MSTIQNKVVIITGASSGIGEAVAKDLASKGAKVVLAARREERLIKLQNEINRNNGQAIYKMTDVTSPIQMEELAEAALKEYGRIDVLINNAGIMPQSKLYKKKIDEWDRMIDVNIKGVLYGIAAVLPYMREQQSGHIISLSSLAGYGVWPASSVYSATKFAVRAIMEGLRKEELRNNIRTTIVSPGAVDTELTETITDTNLKAIFEKVYQGAIEADNIARAIAFAIEQPDDVAVSELVIRPTSSEI
ncbi:SDR family oxidoreductase [Niallia sp. XMNu-256]|uniref:SDR family oxidoreductase n=1 Tax=Niallia sp. XMNu-256 TaxID=3082444 RepID=UPI0030D53775